PGRSTAHYSLTALFPRTCLGHISTRGHGVIRASRDGRKAATRLASERSSPCFRSAFRATKHPFHRKIGAFRTSRLQHFASLPVYLGDYAAGTNRRLAPMSEVSLTGWMKALIAYVRSGEPDLTNRQMALLMLVYLTPGPHTVRGLARVLGVSKPVVTRALNTLGGLGYLRRERDQDDRRNIFVVRTKDGAEFLEGFKRN